MPSTRPLLSGEKVGLMPNVERGAMPAGIVAGAGGAIVRMSAYCPHLAVAHPACPAYATAPS